MPLVRKNFVPVDIRPIPSTRLVQFLNADNSTVISTLGIIGSLGSEELNLDLSFQVEQFLSIYARSGLQTLELTNFEDVAENRIFTLVSARDNPATGDEAWISFDFNNEGAVREEYARIVAKAVDISTGKGAVRDGGMAIQLLNDGVFVEFFDIAPTGSVTTTVTSGFFNVIGKGVAPGNITAQQSGIVLGGFVEAEGSAITNSTIRLKRAVASGTSDGILDLVDQPGPAVSKCFRIKGAATNGEIKILGFDHPTQPNELEMEGFEALNIGGTGGTPMPITLGTGVGGDDIVIPDDLVVSGGIGDVDVSAALVVMAGSPVATFRGFLPPKVTTTQRDTIDNGGGDPTEGLIIYNSTTRQWQGFKGPNWVILG